MAEFKIFPQVAVWELTLKCNMNCIHCGTFCGPEREDELTTAEALQLCDDLAELGCSSLTLSGGEPLLRDDWHLLARRLTDNGVAVGMVSNGYFLDEEEVEKLQRSGVRCVGISIDGPEGKHDEIRRRSGAYEGVLRAMRTLRGSGIVIQPVTTVARYNVDYLPTLQQLLAEVGVDVWQLQLSIVTGRMSEIRDLAVGPEELIRLAEFIAESKRLQKKPAILVGENVGYYNELEAELRGGEDFYQGCYAGLRGIGIESNGNIKGCLTMPPEFVEGNVREETLREIWENPNSFSYNRRFTLDQVEGFCRDCPHLRKCRCGCATTAYGATGSRFNNPFCLYRIEHEPQEQSYFQGLKVD